MHLTVGEHDKKVMSSEKQNSNKKGAALLTLIIKINERLSAICLHNNL